MANIVDSLMDKIKFPEKLELSSADRQLLQKLNASVEELKTRESASAMQLADTEKKLLAQLETLSTKQSQLPEAEADLSGLRQYITDETEKSEYKIRGLIEHKADETKELLKAVQTANRDEELIKYTEALSNRILEVEAGLTGQLRTVKIMMGFTIWISIMALAAMVIQVLGLL